MLLYVPFGLLTGSAARMTFQTRPGVLLHSGQRNNYELAAVVRSLLLLHDQLLLWLRLAK